VDGCSDDSGPRITRVYVGAQQCQLINSTSNELYQIPTHRSLKCMINKPEIGYFTVSLIVSNEFGRSAVKGWNLFLVSPNEIIYNFNTYAEIDNISPNVGSSAGGTLVTVTGKYLYTDENIPALIDIAGMPCRVVSFDRTDIHKSQIMCETPAEVKKNATEGFSGNRGVTLITEMFATEFNKLETAVVTNQATYQNLDSINFEDSQETNKTIWIKGFLTPAKNSTYNFWLTTSGVAKMFLSTSESPGDKLLIVSSSNRFNWRFLQENKRYYFELIASVNMKKLLLVLDLKMLQTNLTYKDSDSVVNEVQDIEISSKIVPEKYVSFRK